MKVLRVVLAVVLATLCLVSLTTCKPIAYYLAQVYKVYGKVTVDGTDPPVPIGSVEVFVGDYQYSELTNYYGDYEIELPEGTWTIKFVRDGYESPKPVQVTVGPANRRQKQDAAMVSIAPPVDLTGYWNLSFVPGGEILIYFLQTGPSLDGPLGITGTIVASAVKLEILDPDGNSLLFTGTTQGSDKVSGTTSSGGQTGTFEMNRVTGLSFGSLNLHGAVERSFDRALASKNGPNVMHGLSFSANGPLLAGDLEFVSPSQLVHGDYDVPGQIEVTYRSSSFKSKAESKTVHIERCDSGGAAGTFELTFEEGDYLDGTFDINPPMSQTVTVSRGRLRGVDLTAGDSVIGNWGTFAWDDASDNILYVDEDRQVRLDLGNHAQLGPGKIEYPDPRFDVRFGYQEDEGAVVEHEPAESGWLRIDINQANVRLKGEFSVVLFDGTALWGDFDVVPCF